MKQHLAWFSVLVVAAVLGGGCGGGGSDDGGMTDCTCNPACRAGFHCSCEGAGGCVPDDPGLLDLAVPTIDQAGSAGDGGCAMACSAPTPYCRGGACVPCLTDDHCPLGHVCKVFGATTGCVPGCNDGRHCPDYSDGGRGTMECCGGGCVDIERDPHNCGACNNACTAEHATPACVDAKCAAGACDPGWGDCNADAKDGCEINLRVDIANCTACDKRCVVPHATAGCADGCYLAACYYGWDDCNGEPKDGCETGVLVDNKNCGACGNVCGALPHARVGCVNGLCTVTQCDQGYSDCNGVIQDGCESNTFTDGMNCGSCGSVCGQGLVCRNGACTCQQCNFLNAKSACVMNVCMLQACLPGYGNCDNQPANGCEVDLTSDVANCGACGVVCGGMAPYCSNGMCTSNPCTGKVGGPILMAMGKPMLGFCWYLTVGGGTCDDVCAQTGGTNEAKAALLAFADDCSGGAQGQPAQWFYDNGNACGWTMPNMAPTGYLTLGHGYNNMDNAGRGTVYMGKCNMGGLPNVGVMPGETNDSTMTGNSRCVVCACSH